VRRIAALGLAAALAASVAASVLPVHAAPDEAAIAAPDGAALYVRCAACHTRTGAGVPGAFPPLGPDFRALATSATGRRYLSLAVTRGMNGPITVQGKLYNGVMPAQGGLDDAAVAAVLNHVGTQIVKSGPEFQPFGAAEVAAFRSSGAGLAASDVAKLHAGAGGQ
jgi:mono/diheme cytochrome c family protein